MIPRKLLLIWLALIALVPPALAGKRRAKGSSESKRKSRSLKKAEILRPPLDSEPSKESTWYRRRGRGGRFVPSNEFEESANLEDNSNRPILPPQEFPDDVAPSHAKATEVEVQENTDKPSSPLIQETKKTIQNAKPSAVEDNRVQMMQAAQSQESNQHDQRQEHPQVHGLKQEHSPPQEANQVLEFSRGATSQKQSLQSNHFPQPVQSVQRGIQNHAELLHTGSHGHREHRDPLRILTNPFLHQQHRPNWDIPAFRSDAVPRPQGMIPFEATGAPVRAPYYFPFNLIFPHV
jgi:hypothetical protein